MISKQLKEELEKQQYRLAGNHSAVKICHWTKESISHARHCYKQDFYGIQSHRCMQMTPCVAWCQQKCIFCWRTHKLVEPDIKWDDPETIIDGCIEEQRKLLEGYHGHEGADKKKLEEAMYPNQAAISLAGEPTLYPHLSGLISAFHNRNFTTFLVTNGLEPKVLSELELPTQLYVSLCAPDEETQKKVNVPMVEGSWKALNDTLELLPSLNTRKALRITLVKGKNDFQPESYAKLISKADPDFIEVKAYMFVGDSRRRMTIGNMPFHEEVREFSQLLEKELPDYEIIKEKKESRVLLLSNGKKKPVIS